MAVYWLLLLFPLVIQLTPGEFTPGLRRAAWFSVGIVFTAVIGLRHQVGADWGNYQDLFDITATRSAIQVLLDSDPGYYMLNWMAASFGGDIHWVNFVCAALMSWGVIAFCRAQPYPWLALVAATPYLLIVVGMGYTRQSVAIGLGMLALLALEKGHTRRFVLWLLAAATFHKTAVVLLPFALFAGRRGSVGRKLMVAGVGVIAFFLFMHNYIGALLVEYVTQRMESGGAWVRVGMNAMAALVFLAVPGRLLRGESDRRLWTVIALAALVPLVIVPFASTVADRISLYFVPIQVFVFGRLPRLFDQRDAKAVAAVSGASLYAFTLAVWLFFASHAYAWVPYRMWAFTG